jgi:hypothetical protein
MVRIPGYVELMGDTKRSGDGAAIVAADAREHVDGHPHGPWVSGDDDPEEHQDEHGAGPDDEDPESAPDSPDESVPMEFEIDDMPR